jgi:hypothetical protein
MIKRRWKIRPEDEKRGVEYIGVEKKEGGGGVKRKLVIFWSKGM